MEISDKDRRILESNPLIEFVSESQVRFSPKFKIQALKLHQEGLKPTDVFLRLGVDPNIFQPAYPKKTLSRWKRIFEKSGVAGLKEEQRGKKATGRPKRMKLEGEAALRARIATLEAENNFLKKLKALVEEE